MFPLYRQDIQVSLEYGYICQQQKLACNYNI